MSTEHQQRGAAGWLWLGTVGVLLVASVAFVFLRSSPTGSSLIKIDSNGTTRFGPVPLNNTNIRDAAFRLVKQVNNGTVSVSVEKSTKMSDFVKTVDAMQRVGITSITLRTSSNNPAAVTNK
jgi:biopolymer transport protein ExbD